MAAITATVDPTSVPPRVDVSLSAWSADGPVTVQRVHADTSVHEIHMPDVSGGVSQAYDYWPPLSEAFTYQAMNGSTLITSTSVTVADDQAWLSAAGFPDAALAVQATAVPSGVEERDYAVMRSPFRETPAIEYGELRQDEFELSVRAISAEQVASIRSMLRQSGVALVRIPRTEFAYRWVFIPRVPRSPVVHYRREGVDTTTVADWRIFALPCIGTQDPEAVPFGDPTASYQALVDSGKTYQQLLDWKGVGATTYLQVLRGGF